MRHGQGKLLANLGGVQLDAQLLNFSLQPDNTIINLLPAGSADWPWLQQGQRGPEKLGPQRMEASPTDAEYLTGGGYRPVPAERLQDQAKPSLGLRRS